MCLASDYTAHVVSQRRGSERNKIAATVVNDPTDPTFRFMTVDWDGKIRYGLLVALLPL